MENENELDLDSQNEAIEEITEDDDLNVLKEKYQQLSEKHKKIAENNKQLFVRTKKAEGFELKDGKWIKIEKKEVKEEKPDIKKGEVDFGQLAFYNSKSDSLKIENDEDIEFLKETIEDTGKPQAQILNSKWFQSELKERIDAREVKNAMPSTSKRGSPSIKDSVDYHLSEFDRTQKLPEDKAMREKIVEKIVAREKGVGTFYND